MNCRQFTKTWNERLDRREAPLTELPAPLLQHAAVCERCRLQAQAFLKLEAALAAWPASPALKPSPGIDQQILDAWRAQQPQSLAAVPARKTPRHAWWGWAAAAALIMTAWLGYRLSPRPPRNGPSAPAPVIVTELPTDPVHLSSLPRPITVSLAEATSATIELARATSAPAARLGRQVIASTASATSSAGRSDFLPRVPLGSASEVLRSVGEDLGGGVEPISGTARKAFGFLLGPGAGTDQQPDAPPSARERGA